MDNTPHGDANHGREFCMTLLVAGFKDMLGNLFAGMAGQYCFTTLDNTNPGLVSYDPNQGANNVLPSQNIVLTFTGRSRLLRGALRSRRPARPRPSTCLTPR